MTDTTTEPTSRPRAISPTSKLNLREGLIDCAAHGMLDVVLEGVTPRQLEWLLASWEFKARSAQLPLYVEKRIWRIWLFFGGSGAGYGQVGDVWDREQARGLAEDKDQDV